MEKSTRYMIEHMLLPAALHDTGSALLSEIISAPGIVLERMYAEAASACGEQLSFDSNSVSVTSQEFHKEQDSILVIRIEMPAPNSVLDCRAIYLCHSQKGSNNMLFSSELGSDGRYYLCGRDWKNRLINFGPAPEALQDETDNVVIFFWEMMQNDGADIRQSFELPAKQSESLCSG